MLDIRHDGELIWDESIKPIGEGDFEKEDFEHWWQRLGNQLAHLEPRIAEQWIHRHWDNSSYCFLDLSKLAWRLEVWPTTKILSSVHISGWTLDPEFDFQAFNKNNRWGGHPTSRVMNDTGTWDYPLLVLETPHGIIDYDLERPEVRFLLIEGHSRFRYLNALAARNGTAAEHEIFILTLTY